MSLFSSFRKALGFPEGFEDLDDMEDISDLEDADEPEEQEELNSLTAQSEVAAADPATDQSINAAIDNYHNYITGLIAGHAENMSDEEYAKLREEARRRLNDTIDIIVEQHQRNTDNNMRIHRAKLEKEISDLKKSTSDLAQRRQEYESDKLSTDRQKRALSNRIEGMEKRIIDLEAEREQLQLENQSMLNRLRGVVMPVVGSGTTDIEKLTEENQNLRRELNSVKRQLMLSGRRSDGTPHTPDALKSIEEKIEKFEKIKASKDAEIHTLKMRLSEALSESDRLGQRVAEATSQIENLEHLILQLNKTIELNLKDHALAEESQRKEIARLTEMINAAPQHREKRRKGKGKKTPAEELIPTKPSVKISAIDELMDNTDWFAAPEPGPRIKDPEVMETFGYKETHKKSGRKTDDNQLTLF